MIEPQPFRTVERRSTKDLPSKRYRYNCVNPKSIAELECIIANSRVIPWKVFIGNVKNKDVKELEKNFGLPLKDEQYARFYRSITPDGKIVYYFEHSAIEYIFY